VDWFIPEPDAVGVGGLRKELSDYLRRHGREDSDFHGAELVVSELLANVVMHAPGPLWVAVTWTDTQPCVEVHDLGPGFQLDDVAEPTALKAGGRGLFIASNLAERLAVTAKEGGGTKVSAVLPIVRMAELSYEVEPSVIASLPDQDEATDGFFGRDAFLRALVVQLAAAVERADGPAAAERVVAQVGSDIGGRMEEEYRRARKITGQLSTEQISDLYVRLKAAIDGDFYVIDATDDRIILGNRRCPFGDVVKRAPGLCRMTSSVFGGIAARSNGQAWVSLEERIAVGDHECRVVVWLGEPPPEGVVSHHYGEAAAGTAG
jgi:anti-sigma regulatory factor (Ser/Thr protein kinase)/predicted ArsR family transcriptional regulator